MRSRACLRRSRLERALKFETSGNNSRDFLDTTSRERARATTIDLPVACELPSRGSSVVVAQEGKPPVNGCPDEGWSLLHEKATS
jgi:hypothetical protein